MEQRAKRIFVGPREVVIAKSSGDFVFKNCPDELISSNRVRIADINTEWWIMIDKWKEEPENHQVASGPELWKRGIYLCLEVKGVVASRKSEKAAFQGFYVYLDAKIVAERSALQCLNEWVRLPGWVTTLFDVDGAAFKNTSDFELKGQKIHKKLLGTAYFTPTNDKKNTLPLMVFKKAGTSFNVNCDLSIVYKVKGHEYSLLKRIEAVNSKGGELLESGKFSDFTIITSGKEFKVHKNILSLGSPVFLAMFECDLDEKKDNSVTVDFDPHVFYCMLEFIYSGKLPENISSEISMDLYELAHMYQMDLLMRICYGHVLSLKIHEENALKLYEFAAKFEIKDLFDRVWTFIKCEIMKVLKPIERESLTVEEIQEFISIKQRHEEELSAYFRVHNI